MYCRFCKNLYISSAIKHPARVKWKLKHGAGQLMVYVVARSEVKDGQLDVIHAVNLKQAYYRAHPVYVYGLAQTMRGAMRIVTRIAEEAVVRGYGGELLRYLEDRDKRTPHPSPSVTAPGSQTTIGGLNATFEPPPEVLTPRGEG